MTDAHSLHLLTLLVDVQLLDFFQFVLLLSDSLSHTFVGLFENCDNFVVLESRLDVFVASAEEAVSLNSILAM